MEIRMRIKYPIFVIALILACFVNSDLLAQNDSLWFVWNNESLSDTTRLNAAFEICFDQDEIRSGKALQLANDAVMFSSQKNLSKQMAYAIFLQGYCQPKNASDSIVFKYYRQSIASYEQIKDYQGMFDIYREALNHCYTTSNSEELFTFHRDRLLLTRAYNQNDDYFNSMLEMQMDLNWEQRYLESWDTLFTALEFAQAQRNELQIAEAYQAIGITYKEMGEYEAALKFLSKSLNYKGQEKYMTTQTWDNILLCMLKLDQIKEFELIQDTSTQELSSTVLAEYASRKGDHLEELRFHKKNLNITLLKGIFIENFPKYLERSYELIKTDTTGLDKNGLLDSLNGQLYLYGELYGFNPKNPISDHYDVPKVKMAHLQGFIYFANNEFLKALRNYEVAYFNCEERNVGLRLQIAEDMFQAYYKFNRYEDAITWQNEVVRLSKEIAENEQEQKVFSKLVNFEFEQKQLREARDHENALALEKEQQARQKIIIYSVVGGLCIIILFSIFLFRRLQVTRKQKKIIEEQKDVVDTMNEELHQSNEEIMAQRDQIESQKAKIEHAHEEVKASINYAERIQTALLSTEEHWQNISPEHFILFRPRDVVSGDFYWAYSNHDHVFWAAADCTGHGVPGAFMSMLGIGFLNEIVAEGGETDPGKILDKLRTKIIRSLEQKGDEQRKDGMDIALCVLNKKTNELQFSGAYSSLILVRSSDGKNLEGFEKKLEGEQGTHNLYEFKADRMPIGKFQLENEPFSTQQIKLVKGDALYCFSDGYQDQFGGEKGKKFMIKQMKKHLLSMNESNLGMIGQEQKLDEEFKLWMKAGNTAQIDDVCIVGVQI